MIALLVIAAGGFWLLGREATLVRIAQWAQGNSHGALAFEGVHGSLLGDMHAEHLRWQSAATTVEADRVTLRWAPWWALTGKIAFRSAHADAVAVSPRGNAVAAGLPDALHLPVRVAIDNAVIDRLLYTPAGKPPQSYGDVAFALDFGAREWTADLHSLRTQWGTLRGQATVATRAPFATQAKLALTPQGHAPTTPALSADAIATGSLETLAVSLSVRAQDSVAEAKLAIVPTAPQPVRTIDASLQHFDPHQLGDAIPSARFDGRLVADTGPDGVLRGTFKITNSAPGPIDARQWPLRSATAQIAAGPGRWRLDDLRADFGPAGTIAGRAWVEAEGAGVALKTERLDLRGLDTQWRSTQLAGTLASDGPFAAQHIRLALRGGRTAFALDATAHGSRLSIAQARASAGGGSIALQGSFDTAADHAFAMKVTLAQLNPAAFGAYPKGKLDASFAAKGALSPVLQVRAEGTLAPSTLFGLRASGTGRWESRGKDSPAVALDVAGRVGATQVKLRGTLLDPKNLQALDLDIALAGNDLAEIYTVTGLPFPATPPYHLAGRLGFRDRTWSLRGFKGQVGRSDLGGDFMVQLGGKRPFMRADVTSQRLDLRDLGGFIGARSGDRNAAPGRLLPQSDFRIDKLNAANADIRFTGRSIRNERLPLHRMTARLVLDGGQVTLRPLSFRAAGGDIDARIVMDARRAPIRTTADVQARGLALNRLAPGVKAVLESAGTIDGRTRLSMQGDSVAAMLGSANGQLVLAMNGGAISDLTLRLADLDLANALKAMAQGDPAIPIRCFVADFTVNDGVLRPSTMVLDTAHTVVRGEGTINLRTEALAMRLVAQPKEASLFALRGPIDIGGTLAKPSVHPALTGLAARGAAAVVLGAIAPPLALIPFLQAGKPQKVDCDPLVLDADRFIRTGTAPPVPPVSAHLPAPSPATGQNP